MKKRISIAALVLAVTALVAVPLLNAAPGHRGRQHGFGGHGFGVLGGGRHLEHLAEKLDLSDQQVEQIKAIYADLHQQNAKYREGMKDGFQSITEALLKNDLSGAQALLDQQTAAERALKQNLLTATAKALNVLTAEQRTELGQMIQERHERRESRRSK